MAQKRSLMEKAVRAAVQRHLRGWAPYPYLSIYETEKGHRLAWRSKSEPLNPDKIVTVETEGLPTKESFRVVSCLGKRNWTHRDEQWMHNEKMLFSALDWSIDRKHIERLKPTQCLELLNHFALAWREQKNVADFLTLLEQQALEPVQRLRACVDVLSTVDPFEMKDSIAVLARVVLAHAMDNGDTAWSCPLQYTDGKWRNACIVAWPSNGAWNMSIVPQNKAVLISDYIWRPDGGKFVFRDGIRTNASSATLASRGSYERYIRSYHQDEEFVHIHHRALHTLLSRPVQSIEPDIVWIQSIETLYENPPLLSNTAPEYYSSLRSFEAQAFNCLQLHAKSPDARALVSCMNVLQELQGEPTNLAQWLPYLHAWKRAIDGVAPDALAVESHFFEGETP